MLSIILPGLDAKTIARKLEWSSAQIIKTHENSGKVFSANVVATDGGQSWTARIRFENGLPTMVRPLESKWVGTSGGEFGVALKKARKLAALLFGRREFMKGHRTQESGEIFFVPVFHGISVLMGSEVHLRYRTGASLSHLAVNLSKPPPARLLPISVTRAGAEAALKSISAVGMPSGATAGGQVKQLGWVFTEAGWRIAYLGFTRVTFRSSRGAQSGGHEALIDASTGSEIPWKSLR